MTDVSIPQPTEAPGDPQNAGPSAPSVAEVAPPKCPTRTRLYRGEDMVEEGFPADGLSERLAAHDDAFVWLDLHDPDEADLAIVTQEFGLHPLAVEDAVHDHQRPKVDRYSTHLFANMYAVAFDPATADLATSEISAFITPRALITVRKSAFDVDALVARWDATPELTSGGIGFLVYGLLDAVVDGQYHAVDLLDDSIDELESNLFETQAQMDVRRRGYELRRTLVGIRRVVVPMRDVVGRLTRMEGSWQLVSDALAPYYQDVVDHVVHSAEDVEVARERVSGILDANYNEQGYQLNQITKKLAAWAAIIAVPTAVTGFYGQNVPYPGFSQHWGFLVSSGVIVVLSGGLYALLRRQKWL